VKKVDLKEIENVCMTIEARGSYPSITLDINETMVLCKAIRAAKQVNEHWNQMGSDGDMPVFQYDLFEALSKIEFGGE